ncbi:MAG TPA: hypothetical protein VLS45_01890 [Methylomicrobium sp.]|nr:hypothetical protein [Methylomicrobium sp.]
MAAEIESHGVYVVLIERRGKEVQIRCRMLALHRLLCSVRKYIRPQEGAALFWVKFNFLNALS